MCSSRSVTWSLVSQGQSCLLEGWNRLVVPEIGIVMKGFLINKKKTVEPREQAQYIVEHRKLLRFLDRYPFPSRFKS